MHVQYIIRKVQDHTISNRGQCKISWQITGELSNLILFPLNIPSPSQYKRLLTINNKHFQTAFNIIMPPTLFIVFYTSTQLNYVLTQDFVAIWQQEKALREIVF